MMSSIAISIITISCVYGNMNNGERQICEKSREEMKEKKQENINNSFLTELSSFCMKLKIQTKPNLAFFTVVFY